MKFGNLLGWRNRIHQFESCLRLTDSSQVKLALALNLALALLARGITQDLTAGTRILPIPLGAYELAMTRPSGLSELK